MQEALEVECLVDWVAVRGRGLGILIPGFQKWLVIHGCRLARMEGGGAGV